MSTLTAGITVVGLHCTGPVHKTSKIIYIISDIKSGVEYRNSSTAKHSENKSRDDSLQLNIPMNQSVTHERYRAAIHTTLQVVH